MLATGVGTGKAEFLEGANQLSALGRTKRGQLSGFHCQVDVIH